MARYRFRFPQYEMDLTPGEIFIGRGFNCQITLDDPLVSRRHAKMVVGVDAATIEDLGSRNGVRVNGRSIDALTTLVDGDRIRIGTQQMMVRRIDENETRNRKATGFMIHCRKCSLPYSTESRVCPNCGHGEASAVPEPESSGPADEPTSSVQNAWNLELLVETMRRAQELGRSHDIERLLVRARGEVDQTSEIVDRRRIDQLADAAVRFAVDSGDMEWARWALGLYAQHGVVPRPEVGRRLSLLPVDERTTLLSMVDRVVRSVRPDAIADGTDEESMRTLRDLAGSGSPHSMGGGR